MEIYSPAHNFRMQQLTKKEPTTLHICTKDIDNIFDPLTIDERSYLGEIAPTYFNKQIRAGATDYVFHGLKTFFYQMQQQISPLNNSKIFVDAEKVF